MKESHIFFNKLLHELSEEIYDLFSPVQFKDYVISQRVIRWKLVSTVEKIKKSFDDLLVTHSSGYGENVVKYTSEEASQFTVKDLRRSENTSKIIEELLVKINDASSLITTYSSNLFDSNHVIKSWKANEMAFYDSLIDECVQMKNATELALGKINSLTSNLKRRFTVASADEEKEKRVKKRKQEKTLNDKKKRLATSSLNLLKEIVAKNKSDLDEKIVKQVEKSEMLSSISLEISLPTLEKFLDNTKLLQRFHLDSLENLIKNNIFEEGEALDRANETLLSLKRKKEEIKSSYLESKKKRELLKKKK